MILSTISMILGSWNRAMCSDAHLHSNVSSILTQGTGEVPLISSAVFDPSKLGTANAAAVMASGWRRYSLLFFYF